MRIKDVITGRVIDYLIEEILVDNKNYGDLGYWDKTSLCKLVVKKGKVPGRATC